MRLGKTKFVGGVQLVLSLVTLRDHLSPKLVLIFRSLRNLLSLGLVEGDLVGGLKVLRARKWFSWARELR